MHDRPPKEAKSATEAALFKRPGDTPYKPSVALRRLGRLPADRRHYLLVRFDGDGLAADGGLEHQAAQGMNKNSHSLAITGAGLFAGCRP